MKQITLQSCPCGSDRRFDQCCNQFICGVKPAITAEELMRSRYAAFVVQEQNYLLATWHTSKRPSKVTFDAQQQWLGLRIKSTKSGLISDLSGEVEFIARYKVNGKAYRLHENSRFLFEHGQWYYLDGDHLETA